MHVYIYLVIITYKKLIFSLKYWFRMEIFSN